MKKFIGLVFALLFATTAIAQEESGKVKQEVQSGSLDACAQGLDPFQVLTDSLSLMGSGSLGWINKETYAHGVHALILEVSQHIADAGTR